MPLPTSVRSKASSSRRLAGPAGPAISRGNGTTTSWSSAVALAVKTVPATSQHGLKVAVVNDSPFPGGECLWRGCIPSKAWRVAADRIRDRADDARLALVAPQGPLTVRPRRRPPCDPRRSRALALKTDKAVKIDYIHGRGTFTGAHGVRIDASGNSDDPHVRSAQMERTAVTSLDAR